jgi:hypothetical protein
VCVLSGVPCTIRDLLALLLAMSEVFVKLYGRNRAVINCSDIFSYIVNKSLNVSYINTE